MSLIAMLLVATGFGPSSFIFNKIENGAKFTNRHSGTGRRSPCVIRM